MEPNMEERVVRAFGNRRYEWWKRQSEIRTRNNIVRRKREWTVANADALNDEAFNASTRLRIFRAISTRPHHWKRYTNVPKVIGERIVLLLTPLLLLSLADDGLQYTAYNAVVLTLTYLTNAMHYKTLANIFMEGRIRVSKVVRATLPHLVNVLPPPRLNTRRGRRQMRTRTWLAFEEAHWTQFNMSHVLGYLDIKPLRVASRNPIYMCPIERYACLKTLVVLGSSLEVLYECVAPGSWSDQMILERSSFGKALRNRANPMHLPGQLRFRGGGAHCANPVFLTDRKISRDFSPYLYVSDGSQQVNNVRLVIERFFGRFVAFNRYFISRTWIEHNHWTISMIKASINVYNFRHCFPTSDDCVHWDGCGHDHIHKCTLWCPHQAGLTTIRIARRIVRRRASFSSFRVLRAEWGVIVIRNRVYNGNDQERAYAHYHGLQLG